MFFDVNFIVFNIKYKLIIKYNQEITNIFCLLLFCTCNEILIMVMINRIPGIEINYQIEKIEN